MFKKHPTLGKRTLARMYFLKEKEVDENITLDQLDENSPDMIPPKKDKQMFTKFLNNL
jgi:hypothetical protein